jgi:hypothetical protein
MFLAKSITRRVVRQQRHPIVARLIFQIHPVQDDVVLDAVPAVEKCIVQLTFRHIKGSVLKYFW